MHICDAEIFGNGQTDRQTHGQHFSKITIYGWIHVGMDVLWMG